MTLNKEEILTEGYLEAYITEDLNSEEIESVASWIVEDEEVKFEYYRIQKLIEHLAFQYKESPSYVVKRMVMENSDVINNISPISTKSTLNGGLKLMMAASVLVAMLSLLTSYYFWNQWKSTDKELSALISQNLDLAYNFNQVNNKLTGLRQDVSVLISPEYQRIVLDGTENASNASAVIYWNEINNKVFLNTGSMQSLPLNKQYQLWALVDGVPVNAGIFDVITGKFQIMNEITAADAFAVTIEPKGGSEIPTLSSLQVIGNV